MVTVYALDGCSHCETVQTALRDAGVEYDTVWTPSRHSERQQLKQLSGQRQVPVIVDDERGVTMTTRDNILTYIERSLQ